MRIVGGALRGRRIAAPRGSATRPTSDRVREAVASALEARDAIRDRRVLDLFAGTGAYAFEALSRGAAQAVLADQDSEALRTMRRNANELGLDARVTCVALDLSTRPNVVVERIRRAANVSFDLVFADPPYALVDAVPPLLQALMIAGALDEGAIVVLEQASRDAPVSLEGLAPLARYRYGDTSILFSVVDVPEEEGGNSPR